MNTQLDIFDVFIPFTESTMEESITDTGRRHPLAGIDAVGALPTALPVIGGTPGLGARNFEQEAPVIAASTAGVDLPYANANDRVSSQLHASSIQHLATNLATNTPYSALAFKIGLPKYVHNGITMSDLARGTGYTLSMVSKIFSGDRGLSMEAARKFAKYLEMSVDEVIALIEGWERTGK